MHCGYAIYRSTEGLYPWLHEDGIAACPNTTYASPALR